MAKFNKNNIIELSEDDIEALHGKNRLEMKRVINKIICGNYDGEMDVKKLGIKHDTTEYPVQIKYCEYCNGTGKIEKEELIRYGGEMILEGTGEFTKCFNCNHD